MSNEYKGLFKNHTLYCNFDRASDTMMVEMLLADRACVVAERMVREISNDKQLYKGKIKYICNKIFKPNGTSMLPTSTDYVGAAREVAKKISRNLTDGQVDKLADIAGAYDDLIDEKLNKLINSVMIDVCSSSKRTKLLSSMLACLYVCMISLHAYEHLSGNQGKDRYAICLDPFDPAVRENAFRLETTAIKRIETAMHELTVQLFKVEHMDACAGDATIAGILSLIYVMLDYNVLYEIADSIGIDLRVNSPEQNHPETQAKQRQQDREAFEKERATITIKENKKTIQDVAIAKGWVVKSA